MRIRTLLVVVCLLASAFQLQAAPPPPPPGLYQSDPGIDLWNEVRQRNGEVRGVTQVKSTDAGVLINVSGEDWRQYRMQELIPRAAVAIVVVLTMIVVFRLIRGRIMLSGERTGMKIKRFTTNQRYAHWSTAILFVILGLTGLTLLLGRMVLIPLIGAEGFSNIAVVAKFLHDYLGPLFVFTLTWMFVLYVRDNFLAPKVDLQWLLRGGGLFGKHAHADRFNMGEKGWFWLASIGGLAVIVSGLVLDFPIFGQTRATMEFYHFVHSLSAVVLIVISFGHIYMGTAAYEGTFEVMKTGYCDAQWARDHHDLWYEKVKDTALPEEQLQSDANAGMARRESTDTA